MKQQIKKTESAYGDTIRIESNAAVFYQADSLRMEVIKRDFAKNAIESMNHECLYQTSNAKEVIRKYGHGIKVISAPGARYLEFVKRNGNISVIDLETRRELCGVLLFNRINDPSPADMMNIETEVGFYFTQ
ncbi:MAG: hypothetical protein EOO01_00350 [Chitinophagaceae bacterium]|nr:MAG: hypothetical protein EOO01_00350 [Chitinophagaceae bacterium]